MKLIVGLGNPGAEYVRTPHNAGFMAIDLLAGRCAVEFKNRRGRALTAKVVMAGEEALLAKPETYMNLSGLSVTALLGELQIETGNLLVIYDELAFPLGKVQMRERGSANGHNGAKSISGALGTEEWTRLRVGVAKADPETGRAMQSGGTGYLLAPMHKKDLALLDESLDRAAGAVETWVREGAKAAMSRVNSQLE